MPISVRIMRACVLVTVVASFAMPSFAGTHICWIDHVSASDDRLVPHFSSNASLRLWGQGGRYLAIGGSIYQADSNGDLPPVNGPRQVVELSIAQGQTMTGVQVPEDSCSNTVVERNGKRGLLLRSAFGSSSASDFLLPES